MITEEMKEFKNLYNQQLTVDVVQRIDETDVVAILLTKEDYANEAIPYFDLIKQLADKDKKISDFGNSISIVLNSTSGFKTIIIAGLGGADKLTPDILRKAAGETARAIIKAKGEKTLVYSSPVISNDDHFYLSALIEGLILGSYEFNEYKSEAANDFDGIIQVYSKDLQANDIISEANILCESIIWTRNLVNRPGNIVQPQYIAEEAHRIADKFNLACEILGTEAMKEKKMGALLAVGKGSAAEPKLITLKYQGSNDSKWIALVGKGITFDSGGISIKPEAGMGEMKDDMAGAAAVLGAIRAIAAMKLPCNVMAIAACAENMPSGTATRPGDIIKAANGKTIEVVSTDAEGRMVLADAVWYACRQGASKVIDIATLTGAVIIALGNETAAIVSNNDNLCKEIISAGKVSGEKYWRLPSLPECKEAIKSDIADLLNSAGRPGGVITGGLFIAEFVDENIPWAHIDIGGTSTTQKTKGYLVKGATGIGVATLVELVKGI
ncbi:MAG: leucyl aminopeptidase [Acidaminococcaceae bacterium]